MRPAGPVPAPAADRRRPRAPAAARPARRAASRPRPRGAPVRRRASRRLRPAAALLASARALAGASPAAPALVFSRRGRLCCRSVGARLAASSACRRRLPSPATFSRTSGEPTATVSPISAPSHSDLAVDRRRDLDRRLVGHDGGEHRVLAHEVADLDVPFDELGLGNAFADIGQLDDVLAHRQASIGLDQRAADAGRPGEVVPFLGVRIGRVPAGDARDRRFEMVEAVSPARAPPARRRSPRSASPRGRRRSGRSSSPTPRSCRGRAAAACAGR